MIPALTAGSGEPRYTMRLQCPGLSSMTREHLLESACAVLLESSLADMKLLLDFRLANTVIRTNMLYAAEMRGKESSHKTDGVELT